MHVEREDGGGNDLEEGGGLHENMGRHHDSTQQVGPEKVDKVDLNGFVYSELGQAKGAGWFESGGPSLPGFKVGNVDNKRTGFKKPKILAQSRKEKGQCSSPAVLRPKKWCRHLMDEEFSFQSPPQFPAIAPEEAQDQNVSDVETPVLDLNRNAGDGSRLL
ncbi:hypothetical protein Hanom_Chr05g00458871 [Helianthus anomalus]